MVPCRVKQYHQGSAQYEHILKKNEQMYALASIALALCPAAQRELDENVLLTLREKCASNCPHPCLGWPALISCLQHGTMRML